MSSGASKASYAKQLVDFIQSSPSPFHTVESVSHLLTANGYKKLNERNDDDFKIVPNGKYFFTRNQTTVFAFAVGGKYVQGNGISIVAAHSDSPCLRVKPISKITSAGIAQVGVQVYGGGLWHTWFDRDLSLAGRVMVSNGNKIQSRLVNIKKPLMFIPNLAIHLNRDVNSEGFKPNFENHLVPIIATEVKALLEKAENQPCHHPVLMKCLANELNCQTEDIRDFELSLYATQPPSIGGALDEFIFAPRLDNLGMSYCSIRGLVNADLSLNDDTNIRMVTIFDHEEIGSQSAQGAASIMLHSTIRRITGDKMESSIAKSFLVSADMAHACHPNYSEKHEARHRPKIHGGVTIKHNVNQRYATNSETSCIIKEIARRKNLPLQEFVVRNDTGCGSTVGPILAANTGLRTIDVGVPQLSMHSIREVCGVDDIDHGVRLLQAFFELYPEIDAMINN